jgi:hypothetical protein
MERFWQQKKGKKAQVNGWTIGTEIGMRKKGGGKLLAKVTHRCKALQPQGKF